MSKVSFVLPAYKRRFLKEAMDSILAQTYRDFELVVVDDDSPGNLYDAIRSYSWEPAFQMLPDGGRQWHVDGISVRYYRNGENIGGKDLVAAWGHALAFASGEWCVLASDDDVYLPEYLSEMVSLSEKYPHADLFHARVACIDSSGIWQTVADERVEFESQIQMVYRRGVERDLQCAPDFFFRRSALEKMGGFVPFRLGWYSDDATWMTLAANGVGCSSEVLFLVRMSGENISSRTDNALEKVLAAEQYKKWLATFIPTLVPRSQEECVLLRLIREKIVRCVDMVSLKRIRTLPFPVWYRVLRQMDISRQLRHHAWSIRYGFIRKMWILLH